MTKQSILYVGGFILPDGNAAAQRAVGNARLFSALGHDVAFLTRSEEVFRGCRRTRHLGFDCYEVSDSSKSFSHAVLRLYSIGDVIEAIEAMARVDGIIAYNYPAIALARLNRYCKKRKMKCLGDSTEWYGPGKGFLAYEGLKR